MPESVQLDSGVGSVKPAVPGSARKKHRKDDDEDSALRAIAAAVSKPDSLPRQLTAAENEVVHAQKRLLEAQERAAVANTLKTLSEVVQLTADEKAACHGMVSDLLARYRQ